MTLFLGGVGLLELLILLVPLALWLWALIDVLTSSFKDTGTKIIWLLVILLVPFLGSIIYLLLGRGQRVK